MNSSLAPLRVGVRLVTALVAVIATTIGAELLLRLALPSDQGGFVALSSRRRPAVYELDAELGFVPRLGVGEYRHNGLVRGEGEACEGRCERVLFLGDSVVHRGRIQSALAELYGGRYALLNAGVEAYGTSQELGYYRRFGAPLNPSHVVLGLHPNDFRRVPAVLEDGGRAVVVVDGDAPLAVSPALFRWSLLYRMAVIWRARRGGALALESLVRESLIELDREVTRAGGRLTVLLLPTFRDPRTWSADERRVHRHAAELLRRLGLRSFDLIDPLNATIARGEPVQEQSGDPWHPSREVAAEIARFLFASGLLPDSSPQVSG